MNETLEKSPLQTTQNAINLLNMVSDVELQGLGVHDRTTIIIWLVQKIYWKA